MTKITVEVVETPKVSITVGKNEFKLTDKETKELVSLLSKAGYETLPTPTELALRPLRGGWQEAVTDAFELGYRAGENDMHSSYRGYGPRGEYRYRAQRELAHRYCL